MPLKIPNHLKEALADDHLQVGSVLLMMVHDTRPPKVKYLLIVGFSDDKVLLANTYINSAINPNKFKTDRLKALHLPVSVSDCPFLKYDSYIDCSDIYDKEVAIVQNLLDTASVSPFVGCIPHNILQQVLLTIKHADTISLVKKKKFRLD